MMTKQIVVQIGANTGLGEDGTPDPVFNLVAGGHHSLLVEPNPHSMESLKRTYSLFADRCTFEQCAISPPCSEQFVELLVDSNNLCSPHASTSIDFAIAHRHPPEQLVRFMVPTMTIQSLLEKHGIWDKPIEWFYLDAEGMDADIILSTIFPPTIRRIVFEDVHTDGPCQRGHKFGGVLTHLLELGFDKVSKLDHYNTLAERS